jgi:hypothetical protein
MKIVQYPSSPLSKVLSEAVTQYKKIAVTGWPRVGKTTSVQQLKCSHVVFSSDDYMDGSGFRQDWSRLIRRLNEESVFIVEGVSVANILDQGLNVDYIVAVRSSQEPLEEHKNISKAVFTILNRMCVPYRLVVNDFITVT